MIVLINYCKWRTKAGTLATVSTSSLRGIVIAHFSPMVGKPNFSETNDLSQLAGSSMPTPGLNALDQEREASMADEGGVSGAIMENQDGLVPKDWMKAQSEALADTLRTAS